MLQTQFMPQLPIKNKIHGVQYLVRENIYKDPSQEKLEPLTNRRHGHFFHYRKLKKKELLQGPYAGTTVKPTTSPAIKCRYFFIISQSSLSILYVCGYKNFIQMKKTFSSKWKYVKLAKEGGSVAGWCRAMVL